MLNKLEGIYEFQVKKHKEKVERYYTPECGINFAANPYYSMTSYNHLFHRFKAISRE